HRLRYLRACLPDGLHLARAGNRSGPGLAGPRETACPRLGARPPAAEAGHTGIRGVPGLEDRAQWLNVILRHEESVRARQAFCAPPPGLSTWAPAPLSPS